MAIEQVSGVVAGHSHDTGAHYIDWGAIIAGTVLASAISIVLFTFGTGIGLSMVSPYAGEGVSKAVYFGALGLWTLWVITSSFMAGGYLAGRLRRRVGDGTEHEVEVRDGAHGISVWALGVAVAALLVALGVSGVVGGVAKVAGPAAATAANSDATAATIDSLLRASAETMPSSSSAAVDPAMVDSTMADQPMAPVRPGRDINADRGEIGRLLTLEMVGGQLSPDTTTYVARLVAAHTGLEQAEAEQRVEQVLAEAKSQTDAARKLGVLVAFLTAAALLVGGAAAAWAATLGGKHRDQGTDFSAFWRWS
jgi:hypothetical protein